ERTAVITVVSAQRPKPVRKHSACSADCQKVVVGDPRHHNGPHLGLTPMELASRINIVTDRTTEGLAVTHTPYNKSIRTAPRKRGDRRSRPDPKHTGMGVSIINHPTKFLE
ncbi:hypothetical protein BaRGS_00022894, partial [Batillaria attramentaria]